MCVCNAKERRRTRGCKLAMEPAPKIRLSLAKPTSNNLATSLCGEWTASPTDTSLSLLARHRMDSSRIPQTRVKENAIRARRYHTLMLPGQNILAKCIASKRPAVRLPVGLPQSKMEPAHYFPPVTRGLHPRHPQRGSRNHCAKPCSSVLVQGSYKARRMDHQVELVHRGSGCRARRSRNLSAKQVPRSTLRCPFRDLTDRLQENLRAKKTCALSVRAGPT